jgi:hypothetical protein
VRALAPSGHSKTHDGPSSEPSFPKVLQPPAPPAAALEVHLAPDQIRWSPAAGRRAGRKRPAEQSAAQEPLPDNFTSTV